ncbi:MAG: octaprenyl diphosphate synthase [uncultured bacterium]|nr:MAG: octaprenyl diphosphate synthase [uncultured bacterium]
MSFIKPDKQIQLVDSYMIEAIQSSDTDINKYQEHLIGFEGKKIRASLVLWSSNKEYSSKSVIKMASAVEIIQSATLIHDDIIDRAKMRRGNLSMVSKWGMVPALLYGDYLMAKAFELIHSLNNCDINLMISETVSEICKGEILQNKQSFNFELSEKEYLKIIGMKTAGFFSCCCEIGALLGNENEKNIKLLKEIGRRIGMAYQIIDDCKDIVVPSKYSGKSHLRDLKDGKITLPVIYFLSACNKKEKHIFMKEISNVRNKKKYFEIIFAKYDIINKSLQKAGYFLNKALKDLETLPDFLFKKNFVEFINNLKVM